MTPCEELGCKVGQKFTIIGNGDGWDGAGHCFDIGDEVVLIEDDGSDAPMFSNSRNDQFVSLKHVKPVTA